jgi:Zn-dependent peptidase ImmA (M78 family)
VSESPGNLFADNSENLLRKLDLLLRPVPVRKVAEALGIEVHQEDLEDDVSGFLLSKGGAAHIVVNMRHSEEQRAFTIAHQIGHFCCHYKADVDEQLFFDRNFALYRSSLQCGLPILSRDPKAKQENDANEFALGLLMPIHLLTQYIAHKNISLTQEDDICGMARAFGVSAQIMAIRLRKSLLMQDF